METNITREITPLDQNDCFTIFVKEKERVDHSVHYHDEYELNLIINAKGARRIIGDHIDTIDDYELVLIGPGLHHGWYSQKNDNCKVSEITVQFHKNLFEGRLLNKHPLILIKTMLECSMKGILFSKKKAEKLKPAILALKDSNGFESVIQLMSVLHELSISRDTKVLSNELTPYKEQNKEEKQLNNVLDFMEANYSRPITLNEMANLTKVTDIYLNRLIKTSTGLCFSDALDEIRISNASKMLIQTTHTIAEIAYKCGFGNVSHFSRLFKRKKHYQPREFRLIFTGKAILV
jgi:YesN/AraC family two-component response regulator